MGTYTDSTSMLLHVKKHAESTEIRNLGKSTRRTGERQPNFYCFAALDGHASQDYRSKLVNNIFVRQAEYQENPHSLCQGYFRIQDQATPTLAYVHHVSGKPVRGS